MKSFLLALPLLHPADSVSLPPPSKVPDSYASFVTKNVQKLESRFKVLGYPQGTTPIHCDNLCAVGIANDDIKIKRMKYVDIKYHWVRDRVRSKCISVHHIASSRNISDYFTKTHPINKHLEGMDIITCSM